MYLGSSVKLVLILMLVLFALCVLLVWWQGLENMATKVSVRSQFWNYATVPLSLVSREERKSFSSFFQINIAASTPQEPFIQARHGVVSRVNYHPAHHYKVLRCHEMDLLIADISQQTRLNVTDRVHHITLQCYQFVSFISKCLRSIVWSFKMYIISWFYSSKLTNYLWSSKSALFWRVW